jgi:hypothetical protein
VSNDVIHAGKEPRQQFISDALCAAERPKEGAFVVTGVKSMVTCWRCIMLLLGREPPKFPYLPEHEKLQAAKGPRGDDTQLIGEFVEWLDAQGYTIYERADPEPYPVASTRRLLEDFFEIDGNKLAAEKDVLLDYQRKLNAAQEWAMSDGRDALKCT